MPLSPAFYQLEVFQTTLLLPAADGSPEHRQTPCRRRDKALETGRKRGVPRSPSDNRRRPEAGRRDPTMPRFSGRARRRDGGLGGSVLGESVVERFAHRNMHAASGFDEAKTRIEPPGGDC
jgi:hypothetical protein